jgi:putative ABC transport system permease protein
MGATNGMLLKMILLQAVLVGFVGFGLGAGVSAVFAAATRHSSDLTIQINWQLLLGSGTAVALIVLVAAFVSARKVLTLEPAVVFKG